MAKDFYGKWNRQRKCKSVGLSRYKNWDVAKDETLVTQSRLMGQTQRYSCCCTWSCLSDGLTFADGELPCLA